MDTLRLSWLMKPRKTFGLPAAGRFDQFRIMSTGPLIVQETHYDPWGVELSGLGYQYGGIKVNPYFYNGKEANGHLGVNLFDYGARMYDPAIGRWFVVDPKAHLIPAWSPYSFCFNNPLMFVDPDGQIPYPITIRAFAPFNYFGGGFQGDGANRGFTASSTATARVHQKINFDTDKTTMTTNA
jgi:RHS repeat-associated protein